MFIPLHVKIDYSLGYGTASIDELVERAAALGYSTLALTDLENLYAVRDKPFSLYFPGLHLVKRHCSGDE